MKRLLRKVLGQKIIKYDYKIVHINADRDNKLTFIPTGESKKWRLTTDLNIIIELTPPYTDIDLENKIVEAMNFCFSYEPDDISYSTINEKSKATKEYNKKTKGKKLVTIYWNKVDGYMVKPYRKAKDRGYNVIEEKVIRLGLSVEKGDLSKAVKETFEISEPY